MQDISLILRKLSQIKLAMFDCDGVITNGIKVYDKNGSSGLCFNVRDGFGVRMLTSLGVTVKLMSRSNSEILSARAMDLNIPDIYLGVSSKKDELEKIISDFKCTNDEVAFVGDDVFDIEVKDSVGIFCSPLDAHYDVRAISDIVLAEKGGLGAIREFCDLVIDCKKTSKLYAQGTDCENGNVSICLCRPMSSTLRMANLLLREFVSRNIKCSVVDGHCYKNGLNKILSIGDDPSCLIFISVRSGLGVVFKVVKYSFGEALCQVFQGKYKPLTIKDVVDSLECSCCIDKYIFEKKHSMLDSKDSFIKIGPKNIIAREVEWYEYNKDIALQGQMLPNIISKYFDGDIGAYSAERVMGVSLREIVTSQGLLTLIGSKVPKLFNEFLIKDLETFHIDEPGCPEVELFFEFYRDKLEKRLESIKEIFGLDHGDLISLYQNESVCGYRKERLENPLDIFSSIASDDRWKKILCPKRFTRIHGDLHFGNLILGKMNGLGAAKIIMIDGKRQPYPGSLDCIGDIAYDFAKLMQSLFGNIDELIVKDKDLQQSESSGSFFCCGEGKEPLSQKILSKLKNIFIKYIKLLQKKNDEQYLFLRSKFLYSMHMITMPPCIVRLSNLSVATSYCHGLHALMGVSGELKQATK